MEKKKNGVLFDEKYYDLRKVWHYNPVTYQISPFKGSFKNRSKKYLMTIADKNLFIFDQETEKKISTVSIEKDDCITTLSDKFYFFQDQKNNKLKLRRFDGITFDFPIAGIPVKAYANNRYAFVLFNDSNFKDYINCFDSITGKSWQIAEGSLNNVVVSQGDLPEQTVVAWHYADRIPRESRKYNCGIRFIRLSQPNKIESLHESCDQNPIPLALTDQYMLWDYRDPWRTNTRDKWVDGAVTSYGLRFHDFFDGREMILENNGCDNVVVDGWNAAWEVYRGKENNEYFNIRMTNLEVTNTCYKDIAHSQSVSEIFKNIEVKNVDGIQVNEVRVKFDQNVSSYGYRFNLLEDDNLTIIWSQGNEEKYLFSPSLKLAARFDADSQQLRQILGTTKLSWEKFGNSYDKFDGIEVVEQTTFNPQTGQFSDGFTPRNKYQMIETRLSDGKYILSFPQKDSSMKKIYESDGHYQYSTVVSSDKGEWLVFVSTDKNRNPTLHVYDFTKGQLRVIAKPEKASIENIYTCADKLLYKINNEDFETVLDLSTDRISRVMLKSKSQGLATIDRYYADNPSIGYRDDNGNIYVAKAKDVLEKGLKACRQFQIGKHQNVQAIGDWLVLARIVSNKTESDGGMPYENKFDEISIINIKTSERILLERNNIMAVPIIMGDYLFWVTDRGRNNLEFSNICFAKLK
ncbi:MAG: hypothetical protein HGA95_01835 [Caldiserica bacterium]|nr:hypothetical protein [Caldisericota bacterium]